MYFQGKGRIRPDIPGIADLGESIEGRDKTCLRRAHLSPDKDCNDHRYSEKSERSLWFGQGFIHCTWLTSSFVPDSMLSAGDGQNQQNYCFTKLLKS